MRHWLRRGAPRACFLFIFCKVRSRSALFVKRVLERAVAAQERPRGVPRRQAALCAPPANAAQG
jgi:hypothetical protein